MASQDTEITLGIGKLLGLFFALVVLCAIFLGIGFQVGRNSVKNGATILADASQTGSESSAGKPNGSKPAALATPENKTDLTFYKAVEQKDPDAKLAPAETASSDAKGTSTEAPETRPPAPEVTRGSGYLVQVAAVSKQEDAQALADALRKKSYAVVIANNGPTDKLYRVQVGPYADIAEAESIRNRLVGDGYNPIIKK